LSLPSIAPLEAQRLLEQGAVLIDIREPDEHARERLPGARNVPLSGLAIAEIPAGSGNAILFHCKSGVRTRANADRLATKLPNCEVFAIEGGLEGWRKAGLPVTADYRQPLELQRQVQISAGALGLFGTLLGLLVSPWFLVVPGFVGAGLITAGVTNFCGMAKLLMFAPWNRAMARGSLTDSA
jgi:rhodanese-related sulfurtransferase